MNRRTKLFAALIVVSVLFVSLAILNAEDIRASQGGRVGFSGNPATNNGRDCTECHPKGATKPTVWISGPTAVTAGTSYTYRVTVKGGPGKSAGLGVSTLDFAGVLRSLSADTQVIDRELAHTAPKPFVDGKAVFKFSWKAPNYPGVVTMYAAGNSTNGRYDMLGDGVTRNVLQITVQGGGATPTPTPTPRPSDIDAQLIPVVPKSASPNFFKALEVKHAGDSRLFVVQKGGQIKIVQNGRKLSGTFLNLSGKVRTAGSNGLLGLAFHPQYRTNRYFYVFYTYATASGESRSRVSRFQASATNPNTAETKETAILEIRHRTFDGHKGGAMHFGPDGYLYIASGDGGTLGSPQPFAQNLADLHGKILRIDVDGVGAAGCDQSGQNPTLYAIPPGNPFSDGPGGDCDEIWAYGLRNPWRFSIDRSSGDLWIADVGQSLYEEIDWQPAGGSVGRNFGWNVMEGQHCYGAATCDTTGLTLPIYEYGHTDGKCSITGGLVYGGASLPHLAGKYLFADFCTGELWTLAGSPGAPIVSTLRVAPASAGGPVAFGEDCGGELYVVAHGEGEVYRVVPANVSQLPPVTCISQRAGGQPSGLPAGDSLLFAPLWLQDSGGIRR